MRSGLKAASFIVSIFSNLPPCSSTGSYYYITGKIVCFRQCKDNMRERRKNQILHFVEKFFGLTQAPTTHVVAKDAVQKRSLGARLLFVYILRGFRLGSECVLSEFEVVFSFVGQCRIELNGFLEVGTNHGFVVGACAKNSVEIVGCCIGHSNTGKS